MDVFENPFGRGGPDESDIIRALMLHRNSVDREIIDRMKKSELMLQPEGIIFKIVETHFKLKNQSYSDQEIFAWIEAQRSEFGSERMPKALDLESYVRYRVNIEQEQGITLSDKFIDLAVHYCNMYLESLGEQLKSEIPINKFRCKICEQEKEEKDFLPIFLKHKNYICRSCNQPSIALRFFRALCVLLGVVLFTILAVYFLYFH